MASRLSKKKRPKKEIKQFKEKQKIESAVFDVRTMIILSDYIKKRVISSVDYPVATGKEADVFRATTETGFIAVKIYRIETGNFQKMQDYMMGDPRFSNLRNSKREIIFAWTKKEFRNLAIFEEAGVRVPKPVGFRKNVLLMEFIGEEGVPDSTLKQMGTETPQETFDELIVSMGKLYRQGIVHADLSEYNILMHEGHPVIIDVGQGVLLNHPMSDEFLERDILNVCSYFSKYGVKSDEKELLKKIKGS
jgi:RIO kinase 1